MANGISLIWISLILLIGIIVFIFAMLFSIKEAEKKSIFRPLDIKLLKKIFKQAIKTIECNIANKRKRYEIPWIILLNEGDENQRLPLENSQLANVFPTDNSIRMETNSFVWHFFNRGVVIELQTLALRSGEFDEDTEPRWEEFLKLCGSYRPQRPLDSVVISVPVKLLLESSNSKDGESNLKKLAESTSRRIWIAQNRYAMRFAVYVVISGCEELDGFESFGGLLPVKMQDGMLGWSSQYNSNMSYQSSWVDEAINSITTSISDLSAELVSSDSRSKSNLDVFLLPSRIENLRRDLKIYTDNLMGLNSFYDPFYFRGIYLTSGDKKPYFLKHIFEEKIFPEFGLAKAAHSQKLKNPMMHGILKWSLISFVGVWSFGLIFSSLKLSQVLPILTQGIEGLNKDNQQKSEAVAAGDSLDFSWYRKTAIALMIGLEELKSSRIAEGKAPLIPFIPGSWPIFDDLFTNVDDRIKRDFAELGINTFRRAIEFKTSQITGADYDELTGKLLNTSNSCDVPIIETTALDKKTLDSLNVQNTSEFLVLKKLVSDTKLISEAISAMKRLSRPSRSGSEDLKILTRYALDTELTGNLNGIVDLFQGSTNFATKNIDSERISSAIRCSLINGVIEFNKKIFLENSLIETEIKIVKLQKDLFSVSLEERSNNRILNILKDMQNAIEQQEILLKRGGGTWMTKERFAPGKDYEDLIKEIKSNKLLGQELAKKIVNRINEDFSSMKVQYELLLIRSGTEVGVEASVDKSGNELFVQSSERIALRDAVEKLLDEPFMVLTDPSNLVLISGNSNNDLISWDSRVLNEAIKLKDYRSKVLSKDIALFPVFYRSVIKDVIDQQISVRLIDLLEQAHNEVNPNMMGGKSYFDDVDLYQSNLSKLRVLEGLMKEMNKTEDALKLSALIAKDAIKRLNLTREKFNQDEFFASNDNSFSNWQGGSGFMRIGFGILDKIELSEVFNAQLVRIKQLSDLAKVYLSAVPKEYLSLNEVEHWQFIASEIKLYNQKDPSATLTRLKKFLENLTEKFSLEQCDRTLSLYKPNINTSNFFSMRFANIHSSIKNRCSDINSQTSREQWKIFSNDFDKYLGGKKPFLDPKKLGLGESSFEKKSNADLYDMSDYFSRTLNYSNTIELFENPKDRMEALNFYNNIQSLKKLFSPITSKKNERIRAFDLNINFRVNQKREIFGNRIIDWRIDIGSDSLSLRDESKTLRWAPGDKITLKLRFASNTSVSPLSDFNNPFYQANKKTAIFRYDDLWSLLDLVHIHRLENTKDMKNRVNQYLKFEFPVILKNSEEEFINESKSNARVYMMINLMDPTSKKPISWPKTFPTKSPVLTDNQGNKLGR